MNKLLQQWLSPKTLIDLINTDKPHAIIAFLGLILSVFSAFHFINFASKIPFHSEQLERARIESEKIISQWDLLNTYIVIEGTKILGSGSLNINMTGATLAKEALKIQKQLFLFSYKTEQQRKDAFEFSVNTIQKYNDSFSREEEFRIMEARTTAELNHEQFLLKITSTCFLMGLPISLFGFYLWMITIHRKKSTVSSNFH